MGNYHDFYLKTDVLLLDDVFEKFIHTCVENYGSDPCHYFSSPELRWDTMLKTTWVELEPFPDNDMHLCIKKGMRGVIPQIDKGSSKGNNKYMQFYDNSKPSKYMTYLDKNDLYDWAMSQYLPCEFKWINSSEFKWINQKEIDKLRNQWKQFRHSNELNELHNDYTLSSEKFHNMMSKYCSNIANK